MNERGEKGIATGGEMRRNNAQWLSTLVHVRSDAPEGVPGLHGTAQLLGPHALILAEPARMRGTIQVILQVRPCIISLVPQTSSWCGQSKLSEFNFGWHARMVAFHQSHPMKRRT